MSDQATYRLLTVDGGHLETTAGDAGEAFRKIKKENQDNYRKLRRFEKGQTAPEGYAKLDIGYGLSIAWTRTPLIDGGDGSDIRI